MFARLLALCLLAIANVDWLTAHAGASTFAFIGDYGSGSLNELAVSNMIHDPSWGTDYIATGGDNNYGQLDVGGPTWDVVIGQFYGDFIQQRVDPSTYPFQSSPVQRFFPSVGNHDSSASGTGFGGSNGGIIPGYIDYFHTDPDGPGRLPAGVHNATHSYYDVVLPIEGGQGSVHLLSMDSDSFLTNASSEAAQRSWLQQTLQNSPANWKIVFFHHSPYSSSAVHGVNSNVQLPFQEWGADAVITAHDHLYERLLITDATQTEMLYLVNGLGGRSIYPFLQNPIPGSVTRFNDTFGALRVEASDLQLVFEFRSIDGGAGQVRDRYALTSTGLFVDLDGDAQHGCGDIDLLSAAVLAGSTNLGFDVNGDLSVDNADRTFWIEQVAGTTAGDADFSGSVTAAVDGAALLANLGQTGGHSWCEGDFNGDGLVTAAADGALLLSSLAGDRAAPVPETGTLTMGLIIAVGCWWRRRPHCDRWTVSSRLEAELVVDQVIAPVDLAVRDR